MSANDVAEGFQNTRDNISNVTQPLSQGVNMVLDAVLYPFVAPLLELLELVIGDPDQLDQHATTWAGAGQSLRTLAQQQRADVTALSADWTGSAAEAYAARINQLADGLDAVAAEMLNTADGLADRAMDLRNVEEVIKEIIRELVEMLIIAEIAKHALAAVTAGASEAIGSATQAAEAAWAALRAGEVVKALQIVIVEFEAAMAALKATGTAGKAAAWVLNKTLGPKHWAKAGISLVTGLDGSVVGQPLQKAGDALMDAAADEYDDRRSGNDSDSGWREEISDLVDPVADRVP